MQNSRSARFSWCEIRFYQWGGKSARADELEGNARVLRGEVPRVYVCTLCGPGAESGKVKGER